MKLLGVPLSLTDKPIVANVLISDDFWDKQSPDLPYSVAINLLFPLFNSLNNSLLLTVFRTMDSSVHLLKLIHRKECLKF